MTRIARFATDESGSAALQLLAAMALGVTVTLSMLQREPETVTTLADGMGQPIETRPLEN